MNYKYSWTEIGILKENWKKIALEFNGTFKTIKNPSGIGDDPPIRTFELNIPFTNGKIFLSASESRPLRISFKFRQKINKEFNIYPEDYMDKIGKFFGAKEFEIGNDEFDNKFFIKGTDKELIECILNNELQDYLINNHVINFKLTNNENRSILELKIVIDELKYSNMRKVIELFQRNISTILTNHSEVN